MASQRCERAHFPFSAKDPVWAGRCLTVSREEIVRVVRREPAPARWCIAQDSNDQLGLLPTLVLRKVDLDSSTGWPGIPGALTVGVSSTRHRHKDPMAAIAIQREEECFVLEDNGNVSRVGAEEEEEGDPTTAIVSPPTSPAASLCGSGGQANSAESHRGSSSSDDDVEAFEEVVSRSRASRDRSAKKNPASSTANRPPLQKLGSGGGAAWPCPLFCKDNKEAHELYTRLREVHAETMWLVQVKQRVDKDIAKTAQQAASNDAERAKLDDAARADLAAVREEVCKLQETCDAVRQLTEELKSATPEATPLTEVSVLAERDPNSLAPSQRKGKTAAAADSSADGFIDELLRCERETLTSYLCQGEKLARRQAKIATLLAALHDASHSLQASECALADIEATAGAEGDGAPGTVREWPRTLDGLTDEEGAALANYVRLHDKYVAKHQKILSEAPQRLADAQKAKMHRRMSRGDAEVEKMTEELQRLRAFNKKYGPKAAKVAEQLVLGQDVLAKKQARLATLNNPSATPPPP